MGSQASENQKHLSRDNQLQNIWHQPQFLPEIAHYRKSWISVFQEFFAMIDKIFILAGIMDTTVSFDEV